MNTNGSGDLEYWIIAFCCFDDGCKYESSNPMIVISISDKNMDNPEWYEPKVCTQTGAGHFAATRSLISWIISLRQAISSSCN